jgi:hypothetical protein
MKPPAGEAVGNAPKTNSRGHGQNLSDVGASTLDA